MTRRQPLWATICLVMLRLALGWTLVFVFAAAYALATYQAPGQRPPGITELVPEGPYVAPTFDWAPAVPPAPVR